MSDATDEVIDRFLKIRKEKGFSILKLSTESGISRSHLYYIETKKVSPSLDTLDKLANTLGIELKDFFIEQIF